jgi:hypothetical protein
MVQNSTFNISGICIIQYWLKKYGCKVTLDKICISQISDRNTATVLYLNKQFVNAVYIMNNTLSDI